MRKICRVAFCGRVVHGREYCKEHYSRFMKTGSVLNKKYNIVKYELPAVNPLPEIIKNDSDYAVLREMGFLDATNVRNAVMIKDYASRYKERGETVVAAAREISAAYEMTEETVRNISKGATWHRRVYLGAFRGK